MENQPMYSMSDWPTPNRVRANGIEMAVYEAGPLGAKPPLVLCHGFPELAFSWRHQLKALSAAGHRVLVPDQRGYGLTEAPAAIEAYDLENLTADLVGLLDARGIDKAVFIGHDWGGSVVWDMARRHPDRVAGVIGLCTPFRARPPEDPIAALRQMMGDDMYIVYFQTPGPADAVLSEDVERTISCMYRRPLETVNTSNGISASASRDGESPFNLARMIREYDPAKDPRPVLLSSEEAQFFVDSFRRSGFTGGINWYRNLTRNWLNSRDLPDQILVPSLMITAELDPALPPSASEGMEAFVPDLARHLIKGAGHWVQQEKPEAVNKAILGWLDATFR